MYIFTIFYFIMYIIYQYTILACVYPDHNTLQITDWALVSVKNISETGSRSIVAFDS